MLREYDKKKYLQINPVQYIVKRFKYWRLVDEPIDLAIIKKYYNQVIKHLTKEEKRFLDFLIDKHEKKI